MAPTVPVVTALEDVTADWVVAALNEREVPVVRVDPADIGPRLSFGFRIGSGESAWSGLLRTESREVDLREIQAVYYRRPTPYRNRFARLPRQQRRFAAAEARHGLDGVLRSLRSARYVNHPAAVARAEFKPSQLQKFVELGLRVPASLVTNEPVAAREFGRAHPSVVCKTFRGLPSGEDGRAGAIWTQRVRHEDFDDSLSVTAHLFQAEVQPCTAAWPPPVWSSGASTSRSPGTEARPTTGGRSSAIRTGSGAGCRTHPRSPRPSPTF